MKFALKNPHDITQLTLGMLLHYLGKLKIQTIACPQKSYDKGGNSHSYETVCSLIL